jgi:hypothetical protein
VGGCIAATALKRAEGEKQLTKLINAGKEATLISGGDAIGS